MKLKDRAIFFLAGCVVLFAMGTVAQRYMLSGKGMAVICVGVGLIITAFVEKKVIKGDVKSIEIIPMEGVGNNEEAGKVLSKVDMVKLIKLFDKKAVPFLLDDFRFGKHAIKIQSDQKTTFLYPDVSNAGKLRVTERLFGIELDEGETEILKAVLEKYEEHE